MRHIYSTDEWGARAPQHSFSSTTPSVVVNHHMDWPNRPLISDPHAALEAAFSVARRCQADHMDGNGWSDTGQHFTITRDGIILEGRHGSLAALAAGHCIRGAHAADQDTGADANDSWGIEHEGTYSTEAMPAPQWEASVWLNAYLAHKCNIDTAKLEGHRDTGCQTACPGDWFHARLPILRAQAHGLKLRMATGDFS